MITTALAKTLFWGAYFGAWHTTCYSDKQSPGQAAEGREAGMAPQGERRDKSDKRKDDAAGIPAVIA